MTLSHFDEEDILIALKDPTDKFGFLPLVEMT